MRKYLLGCSDGRDLHGALDYGPLLEVPLTINSYLIGNKKGTQQPETNPGCRVEGQRGLGDGHEALGIPKP